MLVQPPSSSSSCCIFCTFVTLNHKQSVKSVETTAHSILPCRSDETPPLPDFIIFFKKLFRASPLLSRFNAGFVSLSISLVCHSFIMHRPLGGLSPQTGFLRHSGNLVLLRTPAVRRAAGRRPVKPIWRGKVQLSVLCFLVSSSLTSA